MSKFWEVEWCQIIKDRFTFDRLTKKTPLSSPYILSINICSDVFLCRQIHLSFTHRPLQCPCPLADKVRELSSFIILREESKQFSWDYFPCNSALHFQQQQRRKESTICKKTLPRFQPRLNKTLILHLGHGLACGSEGGVWVVYIGK